MKPCCCPGVVGNSQMPAERQPRRTISLPIRPDCSLHAVPAGKEDFVFKIADAVLAAYCIIVILGIFQFAISAAQVPMLPMVDAATTQVYGKGGAGLAFGAFGTAWAAGTIVGPMVIGPVYDYTDSWGITLGILAIPMAIGLIITLTNRQLLSDCYNSEMSKRLESNDMP